MPYYFEIHPQTGDYPRLTTSGLDKIKSHLTTESWGRLSAHKPIWFHTFTTPLFHRVLV